MIRYFDMFAGIGGFRSGIERAGGFECVGHCEIDRHADASYRALYDINESEVYYDDARTIDTKTMPGFDLLCAGFPCQAFSVAGKRRGFSDPRGNLFFEIARVVEAKHPSYLLLENVPGLLSHDGGRTFAAIIDALCRLGYRCEWQVLNSKAFGVPQSRRRVFIVGYLDERCAGKVLPVRGTGSKPLIQIIGGSQDMRVYHASGVSRSLTAGSSGRQTGLYATGAAFVDLTKGGGINVTGHARCITANYAQAQIKNRKGEASGVILIKEATKCGYAPACAGDSIDISFAGSNTRRGRVGRQVANTLVTGRSQGVMTVCGRIRRLTPRECFRLQGFSEGQIDKLLTGCSDTQAYKQAGNAVTVNVVHALALRLRRAHEASLAAAKAKEAS